MKNLTAILFCLAAQFAVAPAGAQEDTNPKAAPSSEPEAQATDPADSAFLAEPPEQPPQTIPVAEEPDETPPADRDATELDIITVTSSRRVKAQRDLPGSVGAIRGEELEKIRAQGMTLIQGTGENNSIPIIRGIATSQGFGVTQLPVGIYADDLPFSDLQQTISVPDLAPFDLERVEILKGPQGTLFGSGALAGALRYILQKPTHSVWQGKLQLTGFQNAESESLGSTVAGALNVPLFGDAVAIRAVGNYRDTPGAYDDTSPRTPGKDVNDASQTGGRILASWNTTDRLKLSGFYLTQESESADPGFSTRPDSFERRDQSFRSPSKSAFGGGNLSAIYDFGWGSLLSSTNRITKDTSSLGHGERGLGTNVPDPRDSGGSSDDIGIEDTPAQVVAIADNELRAYTQEFRLSSPEGGDSPWEWLVGAAYLDYRQDLFGETYVGPVDSDSGGPVDQDTINTLPIIPIPTPFGRIFGLRETYFLVRRFENQATEEALFGEATRRLGQHWEVTAGGRGFRTKYAGDHLVAGVQSTALIGTTEHIEHAEIEERGINPKFSLRYLHDRNVQAYLLAAKGYQFGGIQVNPPTIALGALADQSSGGQGAGGFGFVPYKSSTLWNYELGLRTEWLDRRLRFDLAFFYLDWTDLQLNQPVVFDPTPDNPPGDPIPGQLLFSVIGNIGAAHSEGAEAALEVSPMPGLLITTAAAWTSALTDVDYRDGNNRIIPAGTALPAATRFQWSNVISYTRALPYFNAWEGAVQLAHSHTGHAPINLGSAPGDTIGGYDTLDLGLNLQRTGTAWLPQIGFNLTNLTDVRAPALATAATARSTTFVLTRPRTALLTLSWSY